MTQTTHDDPRNALPRDHFQPTRGAGRLTHSPLRAAIVAGACAAIGILL
jgi:hypothetical protein